MTTRRLPTTLLGAISLLASCTAILDFDLPEETATTATGEGGNGAGGASTTTMSGGGPSAGGSVGMGGSGGATVGPGGGGGIGGTGGAPGVLVDRGLVARYYMDEAATGQTPTDLLDAASQPMAVPILYSAQLSYTEVMGQRGLTWSGAGSGRGTLANDGSKLDTMLQGTTVLTVEAVIDIPASHSSSRRILFIGPTGTTDGQLELKIRGNVNTFVMNFNDPDGAFDSARGVGALNGTGRIVVHGVVDADEVAPAARVRLYVDGVAMTLETAADIVPPALGTTLDLGTGNEIVIGNRTSGNNAFVGTLYYVAVYEAALTTTELSQNTAVLLADDDTP